MAHIETWYRCPVCKQAYERQGDAISCRNAHSVTSERWAIGIEGKAVRINDNCSINGYGGVKWALKEADLSDFIEERKRQLGEE